MIKKKKTKLKGKKFDLLQQKNKKKNYLKFLITPL
jgi:hypothetical protein